MHATTASTSAVATQPDGPTAPPWLDSGRVPGLDGLRGLAVLVVVAAHAWNGRGRPTIPGQTGVDVFFVLSGLLITLLLLRERDRAGRVDLRAFYLRRALRIFPAYYLFLAVMAAAGSGRGAALAAVYAPGFLPHGPWSAGLGHTWSLAAEEAFYLAWPAVFALAPRAAPRVLAAVLLAGPAARALALGAGIDWLVFVPTRQDGLATGCLLAIGLRGPDGPRLLRLARGPLLPASLALLAASASVPSWRYATLLKGSADAAAVAGVVLACVAARPRSRVARILAWRPLATIGVLSYSLYLWHNAFLAGGSPLRVRPVGPALAAGAAAALASHALVERPFLKLKDRVGRARHGQVAT